MSNNKIKMVQQYQTQQQDRDGNPRINLIDGDIVELRDGAIYFTRKINIPEGYNIKESFERIKKFNNNEF